MVQSNDVYELKSSVLTEDLILNKDMNQDSRLAQINLLILAKIFWTPACTIIVFRYQL